MATRSFDDPRLRAAMKGYLEVAERLDHVADLGGEARDVLDLAEAKAVAGMALRRELQRLGWTAPNGVPSDQPPATV